MSNNTAIVLIVFIVASCAASSGGAIKVTNSTDCASGTHGAAK